MKPYPAYDQQTWERDHARERAGEVLSCPDCASASWYHHVSAQHADGSLRLYRACKSCGFWQEADGTPPYRTWRSTHTCVTPATSPFTCAFCEQLIQPDPFGSAMHACGKYLRPTEDGYTCTTCGQWQGRDSSTPWSHPGSG